jgi:hypothetical protein
MPMRLTEFSEQQRFCMCIEAFQQIYRTESINFEFSENAKPGISEFYRVQMKTGAPREVLLLAFTCPIQPLVYLSVATQKFPEQTVWVLVRETEVQFPRLNITEFRMKVFDDISEGVRIGQEKAERGDKLRSFTYVSIF